MIHSEKRRGRKIIYGQLAPFVCLIALIFQLALPVVHRWHVVIEQTAVISQTPARASAFAADRKDAWRSGPHAIPLRPSHDPTSCPVCTVLSHVREVALTQVWTLDIPAIHARIVLPLTSLPGGHRYAVSIPRAPPPPPKAFRMHSPSP